MSANPVKFNKNSNTNASVVAMKAQSRMAYAGALKYQEALQKGCVTIPYMRNQTTNTDASTVTDTRVGARFTTVAEQATIVAAAAQACQPSA